jgi:hypothetical protein
MAANPGDAQFAAAVALALFMLAITTAVHYEGLEHLARAAAARRVSRHRAVGFLTALVGLHIAEIALYGIAYAAGESLFGLGILRGGSAKSWLDFFYFAAETYSTLGYGDVVPVGALRLLASVEALNGLLLVAWSGAFLFGVLEAGKRRGSQRA